MPSREDILRRLHAIRRVALQELSAIEDTSVLEVVRTAAAATRNVQNLIDQTDGGARGVELLSAIDLLLATTATSQARTLLAATDSILDVSLGMKVDAVSSFDMMTPRRILDLSQQFNADYRPDLRSEAYNNWITRVPVESLAPESALRESLARAVLEGRSTHEAVSAFLTSSNYDKTFQTAGQYLRVDVAFKNLPIIEQKVTPLFRATRLMRTEMGRLDNVAGITFDESAGLSLFINLGVGDDRQSEICAEACIQDAHSLAWWKASRFGIAPRHPFCRCSHFGVPDPLRNLSVPALDRAGIVNSELINA